MNSATIEYEEKRSRFISSVMPTQEGSTAIEFIDRLKSKYWDAKHNVYAYCLWENNFIQRYSDDGEPSGTAGLPMLETIKKLKLQDIVVVITRYFGGTLLGAAGLIRAYTKSTLLGIEAAQIIKKKLCLEISVILEYTLFGKVQKFIVSNNLYIKNVTYNQDVEICVLVPVDDEIWFVKNITEITSAKALYNSIGREYV